MGGNDRAAVTLIVRGHVQGVGFRWWVRMRLAELGLSGSATNLDDGTVEVVATGARRTLERFVREVTGGDAPGRVKGVEADWRPPRGTAADEEA